jgi:uncharacterized protein YyaL (SSP411 family)
LNSGDDDWLKKKVESLPSKIPLEGRVTAYLCGEGACYPPSHKWEHVLKIVEKRDTL